MKTIISLLLLGATALFALAISTSTSTSSVADAAKIATGGVHGRIVKENRYVLFNSRQLSGECSKFLSVVGTVVVVVCACVWLFVCGCVCVCVWLC